VNPLTQIFPPGPPVPPEFRADFERRRAELEMLLGAVTITTTTDDECPVTAEVVLKWRLGSEYFHFTGCGLLLGCNRALLRRYRLRIE
jgi:hypothetical protein